jgi:hypothetical protein
MDLIQDDAAQRIPYDSAWKEALEQYFEQFMAFFFPEAYADIDWTAGYEFLDKELQQVARDAELGKRYADKLVKVWRKNGDEEWVLIHVEVQSQRKSGFAERMYIYNYRLFDRYHRRVASLAVLGDEQATWRPDHYEQGLWGCRTQFDVPVVKLLDYRGYYGCREDWSALEASRNPFATIVMAHLKTQETRHDNAQRQAWKFRLVRRLYEQGYTQEDILGMFRFIDWLMRLPEEAEAALWHEIRAYEEGKQMDYITSVERIGIKKGFQQGVREGRQEGLQEGKQLGLQEGKQLGLQEGLQEGKQLGLQEGKQLGKQLGLREGLLNGIELGLELKFGSEGLRLLPEIHEIEEVAMLRAIHEGLKITETIEALRRIYQPDRTE